jgi:hypothetical protein
MVVPLGDSGPPWALTAPEGVGDGFAPRVETLRVGAPAALVVAGREGDVRTLLSDAVVAWLVMARVARSIAAWR